MTRKFLRQDWMRHSKFGKNRNKLQKWRRPKGRHSKMRNKRINYPKNPLIGYKSSKKTLSKKPQLVHNMAELLTAKKGEKVIIARIGSRKKIELIKKAQEEGISILNLRKEKTK